MTPISVTMRRERVVLTLFLVSYANFLHLWHLLKCLKDLWTLSLTHDSRRPGIDAIHVARELV